MSYQKCSSLKVTLPYGTITIPYTFYIRTNQSDNNDVAQEGNAWHLNWRAHTFADSGELEQNFSPAMIDSKGALLGVAWEIRAWLRENVGAILNSIKLHGKIDIYSCKGGPLSAKGGLFAGLRGGPPATGRLTGGPVGQFATVCGWSTSVPVGTLN